MARKRTPPPKTRPLVGSRRTHEAFASGLLGNERTITVHLPPGYEREKAHRYPVMYLHDGQNVFDDGRAAFGTSWRAADTADRLAREWRIPPLILVGIDNTPARHDEYAYDRDEGREEGGRGGLYGRFVVEELKPFIDREYRTLPGRTHTALCGSSMGGLVTLSMARAHPGVFSMAAVVSPSLWWAGGRLLAELEQDHGWMAKMRLWLCMGSHEGRTRGAVNAHLKRARSLAALFDRARLVPGRDYCYWEVTGGEHNEAAWAARFDKVLLYLFGW